MDIHFIVEYIRLEHNFVAIFFSRLGIPVTIGLFIDCRSLFEVKLLCFTLHIEVLSFEDSEWSCAR